MYIHVKKAGRKKKREVEKRKMKEGTGGWRKEIEKIEHTCECSGSGESAVRNVE